MAETSIEWTSGPNGELGYTFNPVRGCFKVSPECKNCYAEERDNRYEGGKHWGPAPHTPRIVRAEAGWREPVIWDREAAEAGQRRKVFCASLADVMEDHPTWVEPRLRLFKLIASTPHLDWLLLTKRPENFARFLPWMAELPGFIFGGVPWPNVWLGTTAGTQEMANLRIPVLQRTPAVVHFVSIEPQLEHIDLTTLLTCKECGGTGIQKEEHDYGASEELGCMGCAGGTQLGVDWVICGGESGNNARPFNVDWARSLRDQCARFRVPFFMKQFGRRTLMRPAEVGGDPELAPMVFFMRKKESGTPGTRPADLWVRQWPEVRHG